MVKLCLDLANCSHVMVISGLLKAGFQVKLLASQQLNLFCYSFEPILLKKGEEKEFHFKSY